MDAFTVYKYLVTCPQDDLLKVPERAQTLRGTCNNTYEYVCRRERPRPLLPIRVARMYCMYSVHTANVRAHCNASIQSTPPVIMLMGKLAKEAPQAHFQNRQARSGQCHHGVQGQGEGVYIACNE